ncbi:MAG: hypothetical protein HXS52_00725 [Theionarchaea archaeon]|nr:hypothetical protein [Theionarchaea archaeon]
MNNGIAKSFQKGSEFIFVDIESHNKNLRKIVGSACNRFFGYKSWLEEAAGIHDLYKRRKFRLQALITGKGLLFPGHGSQFPDFLLNPNFREVEFDLGERVKNFKNFYVLNLIRLHHSPFNTNVLYKNTGFIFESSKDSYELQNNMVSFIKDWYGLKMADWIDSCILSNIFHAKDLEMGRLSEVSLGQEDDNTFVVFPEEFITNSLKLEYRFAPYKKDDLRKLRSYELQEDFLQRIEENIPKEVNLIAGK